MPRDSAGNYKLVAGNPVQSGEVISSSWANNTLEDVGVALSDSLDRNGRGGMLAPFRFADGTNLLPAAAWVNETSTGLYRFDGGDLRLAVLTQDVMRWQTSGVQIWDATDMQWDNVLTDGGAGAQVPVNVGTADGQTLRWEADTSTWDATSALIVDDTGNVGIGTIAPLKALDVALADNPTIRMTSLKNGTWVDGEPYASLEFYSSDTSGTAGAAVRASIQALAKGTFGAETDVVFNSILTSTGLIAEKMRIDGAGNVGIGTAAPQTLLHTNTPTNTSVLSAIRTSTANLARTSQLAPPGDDNAFTGNVGTLSSHQFDIRTNNVPIIHLEVGTAEAMRIDSAGNVGIGTTDPGQRLDIKSPDSTQIAVRLRDATDVAQSTIQFVDDPVTIQKGSIRSNTVNDLIVQAGAVLAFQAGGTTERMRIDSTGNLLVGTTGTVASGVRGVQITATGRINLGNEGTQTEAKVVFYNGNASAVGQIQTTGTVTQYATSSDERLKENIQDAADPFAKLNAIQVRQFDWKADGSHQDYGFIAQELFEAAPEAVSQGETEADTWGVDPSKLVPVLVKALQKLTARVEQLEAQL